MNRQQYNNAIVNHAVYEIILQENIKVNDGAVAHKNIDHEVYDNDLYEIDNISLDEKKEKIEWCRGAFESDLKNKYDIEWHNGITRIHWNKANKISEWNLLHDILNPTRITKLLFSH